MSPSMLTVFIFSTCVSTPFEVGGAPLSQEDAVQSLETLATMAAGRTCPQLQDEILEWSSKHPLEVDAYHTLHLSKRAMTPVQTSRVDVAKDVLFRGLSSCQPLSPGTPLKECDELYMSCDIVCPVPPSICVVNALACAGGAAAACCAIDLCGQTTSCLETCESTCFCYVGEE